MESEIKQLLTPPLSPIVQAHGRISTNVQGSLIQVIKDGLVHHPNEQFITYLQNLDEKMMENNDLAYRIMGLASENNKLASENNHIACENKELLTQVSNLQTTLDVKQDEMKQLQIQALDRLVLLQNSVKAVLTQTYELHEYPIPRLFIVLPQDTSSRDRLNLFTHKFRLYFLCECGEHTKSPNSRIPHHIHLAKHEGYDIARPNEFFQQYGAYVLTILRMIKFGISVAGVAVPALTRLIRTEALDRATLSLKALSSVLEPGMNLVIDHIERVSGSGSRLDASLDQVKNREALEGADLRQLESFLKGKDENRVLGNLYRTVTIDGHVKWVCIDHYRENYQEKAARTFRNTTESLGGSFDENAGRVDVTLWSRVLAEQFYHALESARSIHELKIALAWDTTQKDFKRLRDTLTKASIGVLELWMGNIDGPNSDILNRSQRYDPIFSIIQHESIKSFTIRGPHDFIKRSSLQNRNYNFSNLRHLDLSLHQLKGDLIGVKCLVAKAPNLSSLALGTNTGDFLDALWKGNGYFL